MSTLPNDIYPESGFRLPLPKQGDMDDYEKNIYDKVVGPGSRTLAGLQGPAGINLQSPELAKREKELNGYLRFESGLSGTIRELAILVTAREMNSQFEWAAHEPVALEEGLSQETIDVVKYRKDAAELPETEAVIIQFGREMFCQEKVTSETFACALKIFGRKQLVDMVALMGDYASTALKLRAFDNQVSPDNRMFLPMS